MPKRRRPDAPEDAKDVTPRKNRRTAKDPAVGAPAQEDTPSKPTPILKGTPTTARRQIHPEPTPKSLKKVLFSTPSKSNGLPNGDNADSPTAVRNDRSAHRKSARTLQLTTLPDNDVSEDEEYEHEAALAAEILARDDSEEDEEIAVSEATPTASTPSKRGRPKGRRREKTPSPPPPDLPSHELYFFQNRTAGNKTSANTLPSHLLLNHDDFYAQIRQYEDPHKPDLEALHGLHRRAFDQWVFELEQGFSICLYGYGSKRSLALDFVERLHEQADGQPPKTVVVNGYTPGLTPRDILTTVASVVTPNTPKLPAQPAEMLDFLLSCLTSSPPPKPLTLIILSLDHPNLRKQPTQTLLARLASHASISLLATCDTLLFPLLWDTRALQQFRWLYHDATTFEPWTAELDSVEEVNALLGRNRRRLGGRDGVGYVLKSLPENARSLFRILVAEQLALMDEVGGVMVLRGAVGTDESGNHQRRYDFDDNDDESVLGAEDEEEAAAQEQNTPSRRGRGRPPKSPAKANAKAKARASSAKQSARPTIPAPEGVEYRTLYHKAVEEFVCSSEVNFRTLLKEFHDHQMIEARKDAMGTERLMVPFRREELEGMLEELV